MMKSLGGREEERAGEVGKLMKGLEWQGGYGCHSREVGAHRNDVKLKEIGPDLH